MKLYILADDRTNRKGFISEHGLSILIEHEGTRILFDTGTTDAYIRNAKKMGVDLGKTNYIILSHGHSDHVGGLQYFPKKEKYPDVYVHEDIYMNKKAYTDGLNSFGGAGVPWTPNFFEDIKSSLIFNHRMTKISPSVSLVDSVPSNNDYEKPPEGTPIRYSDMYPPDAYFDEQMLVLETDVGLLVFIGCSHPGIVNCLDHIMNQYPDQRIHTLVAGMNLESVSPLRLKRTIDYIWDLNIQTIIPLHCTGLTAIHEMKKQLGGKCINLGVGDSYEIRTQ